MQEHAIVYICVYLSSMNMENKELHPILQVLLVLGFVALLVIFLFLVMVLFVSDGNFDEIREKI